MAKEYRIERDALQDTVGPELDWNMEFDEVLERLRDREVRSDLRDDRFEQTRVKMIVLGRWEENKDPQAIRLQLVDWKGKVSPETWAIKITEHLKP